MTVNMKKKIEVKNIRDKDREVNDDQNVFVDENVKEMKCQNGLNEISAIVEVLQNLKQN